MSTVYALLVDVGRKDGDGLPEGAAGAALLCYAAGKDEAEAVRETVQVLREAGLAPLDVTGYGDPEEQAAAGLTVGPEERAMMDRARDENAVIIVQMTPYDAPPD